MNNYIRALGALSLGVFLALSTSIAVHAHVTAEASSTLPGSYSVVTFSIPHGCAGSPTTQIRIEIPETVTSLTPTVNPNWSISTAPGQVVYTAIGAGLDNNQRDTLALSLRLPEGQPGDKVTFPSYQECAEGSEEWVDELAPTVVLTAAEQVPNAGGDPLARVFGVAALVAAGVALVLAVRKKVAQQ